MSMDGRDMPQMPGEDFGRDLTGTLSAAVSFLETLPGWMAPDIYIGYSRKESFRRGAMSKNGTPVISFEGWLSFGNRVPEPGFACDSFEHFKSSFKTDPCGVVDELMGMLHAWLGENHVHRRS